MHSHSLLQDRRTSLSWAAELGLTIIVQRLYASGANPLAADAVSDAPVGQLCTKAIWSNNTLLICTAWVHPLTLGRVPRPHRDRPSHASTPGGAC